VCARWFAVDGDGQDVLAAQLNHADIQPDAADMPAPPDDELDAFVFGSNVLICRLWRK